MANATNSLTLMPRRRLALAAVASMLLAGCQGDLVSPDQAAGTRDVS